MFQADEAVSPPRTLLAAWGLERDVVVVLPRGCWDAELGGDTAKDISRLQICGDALMLRL